MAISRLPAAAAGQHPSRFTRTLALVGYAILVAFCYRLSGAESPSTVAAGFLTLIATLIPALCWTAGLVPGLPVFPVFALTFSWTFALPLLAESERVMQFGAQDRLYLGLAITAFLLAGTVVWVFVGQRAAAPPASYRVLDSRRGVRALLLALALYCLYVVSQRAGVLPIPDGWNAIVRAVLLGLRAIASFVLPFLAGSGRLSRRVRWSVWVLLVGVAAAEMSSLVMISALSTAALAILGYTLGRRRIPVAAISALLLSAAVLHLGKSEMRDRYWRTSSSDATLRPWDYPAFFAQWVTESARVIGGHDDTGPAVEKPQSFVERSELAPLFLLARRYEVNGAPRLDGATYAVIPVLLVPRLILPNKPRSHEGSYLLSIHYGLQTLRDTYSTTIAWGLATEAYANFGAVGLLILAIVVGGATGVLARWTRHAPPLSVRFLFAVLCLGYAIQVEFTAGVLVTALFQSAVGLLAFGWVFARPLAVRAPAAGAATGR